MVLDVYRATGTTWQAVMDTQVLSEFNVSKWWALTKCQKQNLFGLWTFKIYDNKKLHGRKKKCLDHIMEKIFSCNYQDFRFLCFSYCHRLSSTCHMIFFS